MHTSTRRGIFATLAIIFLFSIPGLRAQSAGSAGTIRGIVTDSSGAIVPGATVTITNPVSGLNRTATSDSDGNYQFTNLPLNPYHLSVSMNGFASNSQDVEVRSTVPVAVKTVLAVGVASTVVEVTAGGDLIESDSTFHTDVDRDLFNKLPLESQSSSLSSLVTLASPGVAADSNGLFHGLGDHASNSFSIDGQPITDQQSKVFSNQLPSNSVQSLEVISGAPPAEYGGKTSLVIQVTTRSGQGVTKPTGSVTTSYGTFGSATGSFDLSYGGPNWGNFIEVDGLNTGRFLDPPEFVVFHDKGNELNIFDRIDRQITHVDSVHLNLNYSRSWFQTPNAYDNLNVQNVVSGGSGANPVFANLGNTDQRSKIETFNIAPTYTRIISNNSVFNFGPYVRRDQYNYYPSNNPLADLDRSRRRALLRIVPLPTPASTPISRMPRESTISRSVPTIRRPFFAKMTLWESSAQPSIHPASTPTTCRSPASRILRNARRQVCSPTIPLLEAPSIRCCCPTTSREVAASSPSTATPTLKSLLFTCRTRSRQETGSSTSVSAAISTTVSQSHVRRSLASARLTQSSKPTPSFASPTHGRSSLPSTRTSCSRARAAYDPVLNPLLACSDATGVLQPGFKNEFHAGLQQAFGKHLVISGEYIWKYTHNAFDFCVLGNTPITFPIDWHNSKIPGFALRADVPNFHNISRLRHDVLGGGTLLPAAGRQEPAQPWAAAAFPSASITTSASTRPRTFNIKFPVNMGRGSDSTGGSTAASSLAPSLAITLPIRTAYATRPTAAPPLRSTASRVSTSVL